MPVTRKHGPYGVDIGGTLLGGITRQSLVTGSQVQSEATSGEIYARFVAMYAQKIAPSFSTLNIASALNASGILGTGIDQLEGGLSLYAQKHAIGGTRASGSNHIKYNFTAGILFPKTLSVSHRGDATMEYDAVVTYDGSNAPVVVTLNAPLPEGLDDTERFTLAWAQLAGVNLDQKMSIQIDFGLDVVGEGADSDLYDTLASIREQKTMLTFKGTDLEWFADPAKVPLTGLAGVPGNTAFALRKRLNGGTFVPDDTAEHIVFTANGMLYCDSPLDADGKKAAETSVKMMLTFDGENAPLAVSTATAID